jgi:hypothetical protein
MPSLLSNKNKLPLPNSTNPAYRCITLDIPDDLEYEQMFIAVLERLSQQIWYQRDAAHTAKQVAAVWRHTFESYINQDSLCDDGEDCVEYPPNAQFIHFQPNDPYNPGEPPPGYEFNPWYRPSLGIFDITSRDVICNLLTSLPSTIFDLPALLLSSGLPRFRIDVDGPGTVEIHLLSIPQGGVATVMVDDDPLTIDVYHLDNINLSSGTAAFIEIVLDNLLDLEIASPVIVEKKITGEGSHHIDVTMIPKVELEVGIIPIPAWGGGLRKVVLCGFDNLPPLELKEPQMPVGTIIPLFRDTIPPGCLAMDGSFHQASDWPELWSVLPEAGFGDDEGSQQVKFYELAQDAIYPSSPAGDWFYLPDPSGRTIRAAGFLKDDPYDDEAEPTLSEYGLGDFGGEEEHASTISEMPTHHHQQQRFIVTGTETQTIQPDTLNYFQGTTTLGEPDTQDTGGGQPHENRSPFMNFPLAIIARNVGVSVGELMRLRQSPVDDCLLEQQIGTESWTPAFDFSLCKSDSLGDTINNIIQGTIIIQNINTIYDGTPASVAPDVDGSDNANAALCHALTVLINALLDVAATHAGGGFTTDELLTIATRSVFGSAVVVLAGGPLGLAVAIGAFVGLLTAGYFDQSDPETWTDEEFRDELVCCAYVTLIGSAPSRPAFESAFSGCGFAAESPQEQAAAFLTDAFANLDVYLTFLNYTQQAVAYAASGVISECFECTADCELTDFRTTLGLWNTSFSTFPSQAVRVDTLGIAYPQPEPADIPEDIGNLSAHRDLVEGSVLSEVRAVWRSPRSHDSIFCQIQILPGAGGGSILLKQQDTQPQGEDATNLWEGAYNVLEGDRLRILCSPSHFLDNQTVLREVEFCASVLPSGQNIVDIDLSEGLQGLVVTQGQYDGGNGWAEGTGGGALFLDWNVPETVTILEVLAEFHSTWQGGGVNHSIRAFSGDTVMVQQSNLPIGWHTVSATGLSQTCDDFVRFVANNHTSNPDENRVRRIRIVYE